MVGSLLLMPLDYGQKKKILCVVVIQAFSAPELSPWKDEDGNSGLSGSRAMRMLR